MEKIWYLIAVIVALLIAQRRSGRLAGAGWRRPVHNVGREALGDPLGAAGRDQLEQTITS